MTAVPGDGTRGPRTGATRGPRRADRGLLGPVVTIVAAVLVVLATLAQLWTRYLWFDSVGFTGVLLRQTATQLGLFVVVGLLAGGLVASSLVVAQRTRPFVVPPAALSADPLERLLAEASSPFGPAAALAHLRRLLVLVVPAVVGVAAGAGATTQWRTLLLWLNRRSVGVEDPLLQRDLGFFVFELPWWQLVVDLLLMVVFLAAFAAAAAHVVHGGLRLGPGARSTRAATVHVSALLATLAALQAVRYWLDRYDIAARDTSTVPGLPYAVEHALLPGKAILAGAALLVALFFLAAVRARSWRLPVIGLVALALCALAVGSLYPAFLQGVHADDRESARAALARTAAASRAAFGLDSVGTTRAGQSGAVAVRDDTTRMPLVDPVAAGPFAQGGGAFVPGPVVLGSQPDADGAPDVAVQLLVPDPAKADGGRTWASEHLVHTHAVVAAAVRTDRVRDDGGPAPVTVGSGGLGVRRPEAYFAPGLSSYSVVGGSRDREAGPDGARSRYAGSGGVDLSSPARRLAYAVALQDAALAGSSDIDEGSRVLDVRDPRARVARVAPWLRLDSHPYLVVVDGRPLWLVDGYTSSSGYPGSTRVDLDAATGADGESAGARTAYLRNAVKATVDAYDGTVHLYGWDDRDPVLAAWRSAFPGAVEPADALPRPVLRQLRYPEDLFVAQQVVLARIGTAEAPRSLDGPRWRPSPVPSAARDSSGRPSTAAAEAAAPVPVVGDGVQPVARPASVRLRLDGDMAPTRALVGALSTVSPEHLAGVLVGDLPSAAPGAPGRLRLVEPAVGSPAAKDPAQVVTALRDGTPFAGAGAASLKEAVASAGTAGIGRPTVVPAPEGLLVAVPVWARPSEHAAARLTAVAVAADGGLAWGPDLGAARAALERSGRPGEGRGQPSTVPGGAGLSAGSLERARQVLAELERAQTAGDGAAARRATERLRELLGSTPSSGATAAGSARATPAPGRATSGG